MENRNVNTVSEMLLACCKDYTWPTPSSDPALHGFRLHDPLYPSLVGEALGKCDREKDLIASVLSREYLRVGVVWLDHIKRCEGLQCIIFTTDKESSRLVHSYGLPHVEIALPKSVAPDRYRTRTGFTERGISITTMKWPIVSYCVEAGFDTIFVDIDALILRPFDFTEDMRSADVAFQRVVYFPEPIAKQWGFAACTGFIRFRATSHSLNLLYRASQNQSFTYDDQIALNAALWDADLVWSSHLPERLEGDLMDMRYRKSLFAQLGSRTFYSTARNAPLVACALPPLQFWRNDVIPFDPSVAKVFHPNTAKDALSKLETFRAYSVIAG